MKKLKKVYLYLKNISNTGAIYETSTAASQEITKYIDKDKKQVIVEFGSGTGIITSFIKSKMHPDSVLHCFESNKDMINYLRMMFDQANIVIHPQSAFDFKQIINEPVDVLISSLPISFFSKKQMDNLLADVNEVLANDGIFSQIVYNYFYKKRVKKKFAIIAQRSMLQNFPPAHIFHAAKLS